MNDSVQIVETRRIPVPDGVLEVEMTQAFIDRLRQHFGLLTSQAVNDDHVKMFFWGATNDAVSRAEREARDDARPVAGAEGARRAPRRKKGKRG